MFEKLVWFLVFNSFWIVIYIMGMIQERIKQNDQNKRAS